jgi:DNA ligase-1
MQAGGEGLMLHRASAPWLPGRSGQVLKLKPLHDAEATVVGHQAGRGRHEGRLGALRVRSDAGVVFEIGTGFSDAERARPPATGTRISYTHRGYTPTGVPRFASFLRVRDDSAHYSTSEA